MTSKNILVSIMKIFVNVYFHCLIFDVMADICLYFLIKTLLPLLSFGIKEC